MIFVFLLYLSYISTYFHFSYIINLIDQKDFIAISCLDIDTPRNAHMLLGN